jgi:pSer/pThr/pTyr-binding forkhead associated (FHA) protein
MHERSMVLLDAEIATITLYPSSAALKDAFEPVALPTANLPFTIGGYRKGEIPTKQNDLNLPCEGPPLIISPKHCRIERCEESIVIVDQGSRFCTIVNGQPIGRAKASFKAPLISGENTITLGDYRSPYALRLVCE